MEIIEGELFLMEHLWSVPQWPWWQWLFLVIGGLGCGFINTLAGGGSLLTVPLLIFLGVPPQLANATNRLALVASTGTAVLGFRFNGMQSARTVLWLAGPALCGGWAGAQLAVVLSPEVFRKIFAILLVLAAIPILLRPKLFQAQTKLQAPGPPRWFLMLSFFFVGLYSGFIQVGVGIWSLLVLMFLGNYDIKHSNALKVQLLFLTTSLASLVFLWHDQIILTLSVILAIGSASGAWFATKMMRGDRDVSWIRWLLLISALAAFLRLFREI